MSKALWKAKLPTKHVQISIDLAKDLYNAYEDHSSSASGTEARPNTYPNRNAPQPQNQNERTSRTGPGSGSTGAINAAEESRVPANTAPSSRTSRPGSSALGSMQVNNG